MRRTKIVATLGPASSNESVLRELIRAGLDVARLNFSHGNHEVHERTLVLLRRLAAEEGRIIAVLQDLGGPKIRTGTISGVESFDLAEGSTVALVGGSELATPARIGVSFPGLASQCPAGARIFMDDGLIELRADSSRGAEVHCTVVRGGELRSRKGVNIPGATFSGLPALTEKDIRDLAWGLKHGVDYVGLSFVRSPSDVLEVQRRIAEAGAHTGVIAKIEKPQAVENIEAILEAADGIMIARGDLGVELDPERVPLVQKDIIRLANARERPVITATQMLESMTKAPRPTRAEVSDVANAIFDGTDAVMLSGETASGEHPVLALSMMARIAEASDHHLRQNPLQRGRNAFSRPDTVLEAIGRAAELIARELKVKVIVAATTDGATALGISKSRPDAYLLALCPDEDILRRMNLYWGVAPLRCAPFTDRSALVRLAEQSAIARGAASAGDFLVLVSSSPIHAKGDPDSLRLHKIGAARTGETTMIPLQRG